MKKKLRPARAALAALELPQDLDPRVFRVTLFGRERAVVENHCGILSYSAESVRLLTADGVMCFTGEGLTLAELGAHRAVIEGAVSAWSTEATR